MTFPAKSYSNIVSLNHAISDKSFYTLNLSYYFKDYRQYLFEDIYTGDPNHPNMPQWLPFSADTPATMIFDNTSVLALDPDGEEQRSIADI